MKSPASPQDRICALALAAILLLALGLRLWGIGWSLPNDHRLFSYHPDEGINLTQGVMQTLRDDSTGRMVTVARPHLALGFYNYGGLYFYLWQAAVAVNQAYGFVRSAPTGGGAAAPDSIGAMLLVGRLLTVLLGVLTAWAVYALGRRLWGRTAGLAAALCWVVAPAAVIHGHYATVDVPATFFITLCLVYAARVLELPSSDQARRGLRVAALAGLFAGLAAAAKYNAALVVLAPIAALWLRRAGWRPAAIGTLVVLVGAGAGFALGCPGALIEPDKFLHDVAYEAGKSGQGMGLLFVGTGNGWVYHLRSSLKLALGVPLLVVSLAALARVAWRRDRRLLMLLAFGLPYYGLIGWAAVRYLRYVVPLLPVLAVLVGAAVAEARRWRTAGRFAAYACTGLAVTVALLDAGSLDAVMAGADPRDEALAYLEAHAAPGATVALAKSPWYWTPPFSPLFTANPVTARRGAADVSRFQLRLPSEGREFDPAVLVPPPAFTVVSDLEIEDDVRLKRPEALAFLQALRGGCDATVFEHRPALFGKPDYVPNDWLYIYPRVTVYTRR